MTSSSRYGVVLTNQRHFYYVFSEGSSYPSKSPLHLHYPLFSTGLYRINICRRINMVITSCSLWSWLALSQRLRLTNFCNALNTVPLFLLSLFARFSNVNSLSDFNKIFKRSISGGDRQNKQENTSLHEQSALVRSLIEEYTVLSDTIVFTWTYY